MNRRRATGLRGPLRKRRLHWLHESRRCAATSAATRARLALRESPPQGALAINVVGCANCFDGVLPAAHVFVIDRLQPDCIIWSVRSKWLALGFGNRPRSASSCPRRKLREAAFLCLGFSPCAISGLPN
jgi:hypothetical protein